MYSFRPQYANNKRWILAINRCVSQSYPTIVGTIRKPTEQGSRRSRELRKNGLIPGVLYGIDEDHNVVKFPIVTPIRDIVREMRTKGLSLENSLYTITLDNGTNHVVTPRQLQIHPLNDLPLSVNFLKYWPGNTMRIPFLFVNKDQSEDLKRGSFLVHVNSFVDCTCDGEVPAYIPVNAATLKNRDVVRLSSLELPPGVRPSRSVPSDYVIAVVKSS